MGYPTNDAHWYEHTLTRVTEHADGYSIEHDGCGLCIPRVDGIAPKVGDTARFYSRGNGIGFSVRGVFINGERVYYRTQAEDDAHHAAAAEKVRQDRHDTFAAERGSRDARIAALPEPLRLRMQGFIEAGSDEWRAEFEPYELYVCEQAGVFAAALGTSDAVREFVKMDPPAQHERVPGMDDGHSGNTFGSACRLAVFVLDRPDDVPNVHAAMCPIVGCKDAKCHAARKAAA